MDKETALNLLIEKGYKITRRRKKILNFFIKEEKYHSAKDLYAYIETHDPGISHDTLYRNLHLFHELGILETTDLNAEKHFRINCSNQHHHHFICNECGSTKKLKICPMDEVEKILTSYHIEDHKFEVYGLCPTCQVA